MVDSVSAEAKRKELLDESLSCVYPDDAPGIKLRYKDTSLVLFKEQLRHHHLDNKSFLSFGTRRSSTVSEYGNTPIIVRKSRSANGELSKVAEQWPSVRGRSSVSNYTLHEAREKENDGEEEENLETEEDTESKIDSSNEDGTDSVILVEKQPQDHEESARKNSVSAKEAEPKVENVDAVKQINSKVHLEDSSRKNSVSAKEAEPKVENVDAMKQTNSKEHHEHQVQESDECLGGEVQDKYVQECGNRKSFSQYDLHLQRHRDYVDEEPEDDEARGEEMADRENGDRGEEDRDADSMRTVLEVEGVDHKIVLLRPTNKRENDDFNVGSKHVKLRNRVEGEHKVEREQKIEYNVTKRDAVLLESHEQKAADAILQMREDSSVGASDQNSQDKDDVKFDVPENGSVCGSSDQATSDNWREVELRIIEESDLRHPNTCTNASANVDVISCTTRNGTSLTSKLLQGSADDNDDVVFIDDCSQSSARLEKGSDSCVELAVESIKSAGATSPIPPKRRPKTPSESSSPLMSKSTMGENCTKNGGSTEEADYIDADDQNGLLALPVRSPTPPKRSPRRSPRVPKRKEKNQDKVSPSESVSIEQVPSVTKPVASVSPAIKSKESNRLFSFSLKKERSKSVSSLSPKKSKERIPTRSESEDTGIVNSLRSSDVDEDSKFESSGKRVGVRSLVIDGTIKRNFIVIHPSDDSDTIGLAPLSSFGGNQRHSLRASKALSSVKSHISGKSSTKIEIVRKISSKQELREELLNASKDVRDRESLNSDSTTEKSRARKPGSRKKKDSHQKDSHLRWSSVSLSSASPHVKTKVRLGSTGGLSEIDCDAITVSSQGINASSTKTTSRLCVVM